MSDAFSQDHPDPSGADAREIEQAEESAGAVPLDAFATWEHVGVEAEFVFDFDADQTGEDPTGAITLDDANAFEALAPTITVAGLYRISVAGSATGAGATEEGDWFAFKLAVQAANDDGLIGGELVGSQSNTSWPSPAQPETVRDVVMLLPAGAVVAVAVSGEGVFGGEEWDHETDPIALTLSIQRLI